jgi:hypothetical protein
LKSPPGAVTTLIAMPVKNGMATRASTPIRRIASPLMNSRRLSPLAM